MHVSSDDRTHARPEPVAGAPEPAAAEAARQPPGAAVAARLAQAGAAAAPRGGAATPLSARHLASLQRSAGNASVVNLVARRSRSAAPVVQRDDKDVAVSGVSLNHTKVTVPPEAGLALQATATPAKATGVTWSLEKGSVDPTGVTIDASSGAITVAAGQQGGTVKVKATSSDGSFAWTELRLIEKPAGIASTSTTAAGGAVYGGEFTHTFTAPSGKAAGLDGANINEKFGSLTAQTPFGSFTLSANKAGSHGWDLDASGTMAGPDNVTIKRKGVTAGDFIASTSNPTPKALLPQGFTMTQSLHAKSLPSGKLDAAAFMTVAHARTLKADGTFVVEAGKGSISDDYTGPPAFSKIAASPATVEASVRNPKKPGEKGDPGWATQHKVTVSCTAYPTSATPVYSIQGAKLGCTIDASTGEVTIGDTPGTITVRASAGAGGTHYDEVTITITAPPKPAAKPQAELGEGAVTPGLEVPLP